MQGAHLKSQRRCLSLMNLDHIGHPHHQKRSLPATIYQGFPDEFLAILEQDIEQRVLCFIRTENWRNHKMTMNGPDAR